MQATWEKVKLVLAVMRTEQATQRIEDQRPAC